jgi:hypothetical protein
MRTVIGIIVASAVIAAGAALAQEAARQVEPAGEPDLPRLGDIMVLQQMRHIKLWFAGSAANWPLADYEIDQLDDGFDAATKLLGGDIVRQHVGEAMSELKKSVDGKDSAAFAIAFDKLSSGCNACHHTLDHGFIVIQRPRLLPYSNQDFAPQK